MGTSQWKLLYVCTYWGVRSQIAARLTDALSNPNVQAECAGLESGKIGAPIRELLSTRGIELSTEGPTTIFNKFRQGTKYDFVITLCSHDTQENSDVLLNMVDQLFASSAEVVHWNIADFMAVKATGAERKTAMLDIVNEIEQRVRDFVSGLESGASPTQLAASNSP